jgi:hypothetical protein
VLPALIDEHVGLVVVGRHFDLRFASHVSARNLVRCTRILYPNWMRRSSQWLMINETSRLILQLSKLSPSQSLSRPLSYWQAC